MTDPKEIPARGMGGRYGSDRPRRRWVAITLGTLFAAALTAWAIWAAMAQDDPSVSGEVTAYHVVSSHEVQVKVDLHLKDPAAVATCLIRATAEDHTVVGELNLSSDEIQAATGTWIPVRTERRATTASLVTCTE